MPAGESARAKATQLRTKAEQLHAWAANWDAGALGEERVAEALAAADQREIRVLHDRLLEPSRSRTNIDHLVVAASGIYLIDAKNWSGRVTVEGGSLCQQRSTPEGSRTSPKDGELRAVRRVAAQISTGIGQPVTPVLCLANDEAEAFGRPREVGGVHVVPVSELLPWLEGRPHPRKPINVATVAVELSCAYPPAGRTSNNTHDLYEWTDVGPARAATKPVTQPGRRRSDAPRRGAPGRRAGSAAQLVGVLLAVLAFAVFGPKLLGLLGKSLSDATRRAVPPAAAATPSPHSTLSVAQAGALEDWTIRAGLYAANDKPSTLPYVADANLATQERYCRTQRTRLEPLRHGLLAAPDPQLAAAAKRFDTAVHHLLRACIDNDPVALHDAEGEMTAAASDVNVRYNRLIGIDPTAYTAKRVL